MQGPMPVAVAGGGRQISGAVAEIGVNNDINLNPRGPPHTVYPGIVAGIPKLKLEPEGGPACSANLTSADHSIQLASGTELILTLQSPVP